MRGGGEGCDRSASARRRGGVECAQAVHELEGGLEQDLGLDRGRLGRPRPEGRRRLEGRELEEGLVGDRGRRMGRPGRRLRPGAVAVGVLGQLRPDERRAREGKRWGSRAAAAAAAAAASRRMGGKGQARATDPT